MPKNEMYYQAEVDRTAIAMGFGDGLLPPTAAELASMRRSPNLVEPTWFGDPSKGFPLMDPASLGGQLYNQVQCAYGKYGGDTQAAEVIRLSRELIEIHPLYIPAHVYEELGMNACASFTTRDCLVKLDEVLWLLQELLEGKRPWKDLPPTLRPVTRENLLHEQDRLNFNKAHRLLLLNDDLEAIPDLIRHSFSSTQDAPSTQRRLGTLAEALYRLGDVQGSNSMMQRARNIDPMNWEVLREGMISTCPSLMRIDWR